LSVAFLRVAAFFAPITSILNLGDFLMFKIKKIAGVVSAVAVTSVLTVSTAFAEVSVDAFDDAKTDVVTVGTAALGVLVAAATFKYIRRAL
jgi:hypothetical protein